MSSLIEKLALEGTLLCPGCRKSAWELTNDWWHCANCNTSWPVRNQVPDLFNRYRAASAQPVGALKDADHALVDAIMRALELEHEDEDDMSRRIAEIVSRASALACEDDAYTAEINDLRDRFAPDHQLLQDTPTCTHTEAPRLRLERHYLPPSVAPNQRISANIRVTNVGESTWTSRTNNGLLLSAAWRGDAASSKNITQARFPVDITPGRTISLPMPLVTPNKPGNHGLCLQLRRMDTGESVGNRINLQVKVEPLAAKPNLWQYLCTAIRAQPAAPIIKLRPQIDDYGEDHAVAAAMIENSLDKLGLRNARILEVGSGTHPHTAWLTQHQVVALDISSPLLELGSLYFKDRFIDRLGFICADAFAAPFTPKCFDLVCMFSALHHFQEPETILRQLSGLLKEGGQLAVMCEPVGESLEQPETVRDLQKGINEQVFTIAEYRLIFSKAGLATDHMQVDGASLKTLLRCENKKD